MQTVANLRRRRCRRGQVAVTRSCRRCLAVATGVLPKITRQAGYFLKTGRAPLSLLSRTFLGARISFTYLAPPLRLVLAFFMHRPMTYRRPPRAAVIICVLWSISFAAAQNGEEAQAAQRRATVLPQSALPSLLSRPRLQHEASAQYRGRKGQSWDGGGRAGLARGGGQMKTNLVHFWLASRSLFSVRETRTHLLP